MRVGDKVKWVKDGRVDRVVYLNPRNNECFLSRSGTWSLSFVKVATVPYNTKYYYERIR